jgi:hypothetical protein
MKQITIPLSLALCAMAGQGMAQGLSALELSIETLAWADGGQTGDTTYGGSIEFAITPGIGFAADLTSYGAPDATNVTLHGLYGLGAIDLGLFAARDSRDVGDTNLLGLEAAMGFGAASVEGYFGMVEGRVGDGTTAGVAGRFDLARGISATGAFGILEADSSANRISVGGEYAMPAGPVLFGELGRIVVDGEDEAYLSIGARVAVGPNGRTTFGGRSLYEILPGY